MEYDIIAAGFGGQGIVQLGRIIATCGMLKGWEITCLAAYGIEMRGGTANCTVRISSDAIGSPIIANPDALIAMNQPSLNKFGPMIKSAGTVVINTSLADDIYIPFKDDTQLIGVDATCIAGKMGQPKVANMIALGAFIKHTKLFSLNTVKRALTENFSGDKARFIEINNEALIKGSQAFKLL